MLERQGGKCAICGAGPGSRVLHVDHCHASGSVRELLCAGCNTKVGALESELMPKVMAYLLKHAPEVA